MDMDGIRKKAASEELNIIPYVRQINSLIKYSPLGTEFRVPRNIIPSLERHCDYVGIPFKHVGEDCCSVAVSYSSLLAYEESR